MATKSKNSSGKNTASESTSRTADAYQSTRTRTASTFASTRESVSDATRRTGQGITSNPVGALVGGFAIGALVGVAIPATRRERQALQPLGEKISDAARTAARQAAEQGRDKLNRLTGEVVTQVGSKVVDAVAPPQGSNS